ncbi:MAG TPA: AraC family transcriptional regulator [Blastocatellia bacterium]
MNSKTRAAISLIEENLHRQIYVGEIAKSLGLHRSRFCDLFKGEVEVSPTQHIKKRRLEKARELLEATDLQIKEIAVRVSYSESSHFVRNFEKAYGLSPRRYRAQHLLSKLQNRRSKKEKRRIG